MSGGAKGTFTPIYQTFPNPDETDWEPPEDIPSKEEMEKSNQIVFGESESGAMHSRSSQSQSMPRDEVSAMLREMLVTLEGRIADLNFQGADLFKASKYVAAAEKAEQGKTLAGFLDKVQDLHVEWASIAAAAGSSRSTQTERKSSNPTNPQRRPPKTLVVSFDDGTTISETSSRETFAKCISKVGMELVRSLEIERYGLPLVSPVKPEKYASVFIEGMYLNTHFNAEDKAKLLNRISEMTGVGMDVSIERQ